MTFPADACGSVDEECSFVLVAVEAFAVVSEPVEELEVRVIGPESCRCSGSVKSVLVACGEIQSRNSLLRLWISIPRENLEVPFARRNRLICRRVALLAVTGGIRRLRVLHN